MARDGMLWVSWPKGISSLETDLGGDHVPLVQRVQRVLDAADRAVDG